MLYLVQFQLHGKGCVCPDGCSTCYLRACLLLMLPFRDFQAHMLLGLQRSLLCCLLLLLHLLLWLPLLGCWV
jgi:hypothetical protein